MADVGSPTALENTDDATSRLSLSTNSLGFPLALHLDTTIRTSFGNLAFDVLVIGIVIQDGFGCGRNGLELRMEEK